MAGNLSAKLFAVTLAGLGAAGGLLALTGASGSQAQTQMPPACLAHDELEAGLSRDYQERQSAYGQIGDQTLMEIYASDSGTWTLVMTGVNGQSCIVAAGEGFEQAVVRTGSGA
jgi:hypothetical protein